MATLLSKDEYTVLNEQRNNIESWIRVKVCRNIPREWLHKAALINMKIFKAPYADITCNECIGKLLERLYYPMLEYEEELKKQQEETLIEDLPRKGRKPKDWYAKENKD